MRPLCMDGIQNQDETDTDCGGSTCSACALLDGCAADSDCVTGAVCTDGLCQAATCSDTTLNGMETDVDCGGAECAPCADGEMCSTGTDCVSGGCTSGTCTSCTDGVMNGAETDVDCGGPGCGPCGDGLMCVADADCSGTACEASACVSCSDGAQNAAETDVDCGGPDCADRCADLDSCSVDGDCVSGSCDTGTCRSCTDGVQNGMETDVDCGGAASGCGLCGGGDSCTGNADCLSGLCVAGSCTAAMFSDNFETGMFSSVWSTSGDASWFVSMTTPLNGLFSAESGDINDSEVSNLDLMVTCAPGATVQFNYRTDVEAGWDYLDFIVDGSIVDSYSDLGGTTTSASYPLMGGTHTLRWQYNKDSSTSSGADTVWIDDVVLTDCTAP